MSLLKLVEKEEATGKVAAIYEGMIKNMGFIPNAFKLFSPSEYLFERQASNLQFYMQHETLSGKLLAFIRLLVSEKEHCAYCVGMNSGILLHYGVRPEELAPVKEDPSKAPLDEKELAMLLFALKVVNDSNFTTEADMNKLRSLGWSDAEILEGTYHAASQVATDYIFNAFKLESDK